VTVVAKGRRVIAVLLLALWWGGFSFYAARVVFIGHEVLRSKIRQGFITERVTTELNWLALAALAVAGWELFASRSTTRRTAWFSWAVALLCTGALFALHSKLAGMLDFTARQVADDAHFYQWHRVYLLLAAVQWLAVAVLGLMFHFTTWPTQASKTDAG
jgi:hypothetical protein